MGNSAHSATSQPESTLTPKPTSNANRSRRYHLGSHTVFHSPRYSAKPAEPWSALRMRRMQKLSENRQPALSLPRRGIALPQQKQNPTRNKHCIFTLEKSEGVLTATCFFHQACLSARWKYRFTHPGAPTNAKPICCTLC